MFRICKAELKKLFLKPSIFVVAGILIVVLAFSSFLYHPNNRDAVQYTVPTGVEKKVDSLWNFLENSSSNSFISFNAQLISTQSFLNGYTTELNAKEKLTESLTRIIDAHNDYKEACISFYDTHTVPELTVKKELNDWKQSFEDFLNEYKSYTSNKHSIHLLATSTLDLNIKNFIEKCILAMTNYSSYTEVYSQIGQNYKFREVLEGYISELKAFTPNVEYVLSLQEYIDGVAERLGLVIEEGVITGYSTTGGLHQEIKDFVDSVKTNNEKNTDKDNFEKLKNYATQYEQQISQVNKIVTNGIYINALSEHSQKVLNEFLGLEDFDYYQQQEDFAKQVYLYKSNSTLFDYANPFSIDQPSNFQLNGFDFSYFALRLCMFIIVIYVVCMAATTITGEQSSGTIKMLAIRPYRREKLVLGKLLATVLIGIILISVSALATLAIGWVTYGLNSAPILAVFNASAVSIIGAFWFYLLMILTLIFEMLFFVLVALAISMLFKSQILSVSVSILIYFGSLVLNTMLSASSWLRFLPFTNINLYKYFGGSFLSTHGGFIQSVLTSPVAVGASFWGSFVYSAIIMTGLVVLVVEVFKHRDIR